MIGVIANLSEYPVVREFFELFKTPWEFYRHGERYDVVLCTGDNVIPPNAEARLSITYSGRKLPAEAGQKIQNIPQSDGYCLLSYGKQLIPIYGSAVHFEDNPDSSLICEASQRPAMYQTTSGDSVSARIGYDLFEEVRILLTVGQPIANAGRPALELHIAFLRDLITGSGISMVEIPPVPEGYRFLACLTHDVDHPSLRLHKFDHTMAGFLYRATVGSLTSLLRGRLSFHDLLSNWTAALKLPLVFLGLAEDFWLTFDRYTELEREVRSSFFVIPFKNDAGSNGSAPAPRRRASGYAAIDIAAQIQHLAAAGCEIGVHGLNSWCDRRQGREEFAEIRRVSGRQQLGIRMHWLYFDEQSPVTLEKAGYDYDSTVGYNETIGYRAGTTQAYKPLQAEHLLELPLHIMDTALFYPCYLGLSAEEATRRVATTIADAVQWGGCLTVNWHDRSIAPERQWADFYVQLVHELKDKQAWIGTASQVVEWFRMRRSATFQNVSSDPEAVRVTLPEGINEKLPSLQLRTHKPAGPKAGTALAELKSHTIQDIPLKPTADSCVAFA